MCDFLSVYVGWNGEIYCGDLQSHHSAEEAHELSERLKSRRPPVPMEWTQDDAGKSLSIRVPDSVDRDEAFYKAMILGDYPNRAALLDAILTKGLFGKNLDLRGTGITSLPDGLSVGGYLDLENCEGITSLPDGLSVGGYLDLRGTGITSLPDGLSVGGRIIRE